MARIEILTVRNVTRQVLPDMPPGPWIGTYDSENYEFPDGVDIPLPAAIAHHMVRQSKTNDTYRLSLVGTSSPAALPVGGKTLKPADSEYVECERCHVQIEVTHGQHVYEAHLAAHARTDAAAKTVVKKQKMVVAETDGQV